MRIARNPSLVLGPEAGINCRKHGRVRCKQLRCLLLEFEKAEAEVLDISASGMRLRARKAVDLQAGSGTLVAISSFAGTVQTPVRVVWAKRRAFRQFEMGVTFGDPTPQLRNILGQVMRDGADTYTIYQGE